MARWATPQETADYIKRPLSTLYNWRYRGVGPTGYRTGRHVRYDLDEVDEWMRTGDDCRPEPATA